jgi:membrane complex biogenesis BtpA family protein
MEKRETLRPQEGAREHQRLWGDKAPIVGVIHLPPLPGSPGWRGSMDEVITHALEDAGHLITGGLDGILVENFGDAPFFPGAVPPETLTAMAVVVREIAGTAPAPVGVNVLRNDALGAMAVAIAAGGSFIRVNVHTGSMFTDQGLLHGAAHRTLRMRNALGAPIAILADVLVKHATPTAETTLEGAARDTWLRGLADGVILTGTETGAPVCLGELERVRKSLPPEAKLWIGSGVTPETASDLLAVADGLIVGSAFKAQGRAGNPVEASRVRNFMAGLGRG